MIQEVFEDVRKIGNDEAWKGKREKLIRQWCAFLRLAIS